MRWSDVKERAATNTTWQWHLPRALDALKEDCLKRIFGENMVTTSKKVHLKKKN